MAQLRKYQANIIVSLFDKIRAGAKNLLIVLSCGGGKSTIFASVFELCFRQNKRALFVVHRRGLVWQFKKRMASQFDIGSGVIMSGVERNLRHPLQVASIDTLMKMDRALWPQADFVLIDEAHNAKAAKYKCVFEHYANNVVCGMTATWRRLDGSPLGDLFSDYVQVIKMWELINQGFLCQTKCYEPEIIPDLSDLKRSGDDFNSDQLFKKYDSYSIYMEMVKLWKEIVPGKKTIWYCVNREHAKKMVACFEANGVPSAYVDGETDDSYRDDVYRKVVSGEIICVMNVAIYIEGTDIPEIEVTGLAHATASETRYVQEVGRCQRTLTDGSKKFGYVLDFGKNVERHGFVEDYDIDPVDLNAKPKKKMQGETVTRTCPQCRTILKVQVKQCPCGYVFPVKKDDAVVAPNGMKLVLMEREAIVVRKMIKMSHADLKKQPIGKLLLAEKLMGYKNGWAVNTVKDREPKWKACTFGQIVRYLESEERKMGLHELRAEIIKRGDEFIMTQAGKAAESIKLKTR